MKKKLTAHGMLSGVILSVLMLVCMLLPYANYTYKKMVYTLSGFEFLTGGTISGGKVTYGTNVTVVLSLVFTVLILVLAAAYPKMKKTISAGLITLLGIFMVVANIIFANQLESALDGAKKVSVAYGNVILIVLAVLVVIRGLIGMYRLKTLSMLDFMVLPGMLYFIINNYIPMVGIVIAFKSIDYSKGVFASPWAGLKNFQMLFASNSGFFQSDAWVITRNTLLYNIVFIVLGLIAGILMGICLADIANKTLQKFFQTSILLPQLISMVIVAYIVYALLSNETGMINHMLGDNAINFYSEKKYWPFILVFIYIWKQIGYNAIIFLSSIVGIDKSLYEAAKVDGATKWQQIRRVTLPLLKPTIITITLLQVGRIFYSDFGLFYQVPLDSGALYSVTDTIDTYVFRLLMKMNNVAVSSAASTYQAIVGFIIVMAVNLIVRKADKENALF